MTKSHILVAKCGVLIHCFDNQIMTRQSVRYMVMVVCILVYCKFRTKHPITYLYILTCSDPVGVWKAISAGITILHIQYSKYKKMGEIYLNSITWLDVAVTSHVSSEPGLEGNKVIQAHSQKSWHVSRILHVRWHGRVAKFLFLRTFCPSRMRTWSFSETL